MSLKTLAQRKFLKGLVATTPKWEQTPGSFPRISNLIYSDRGGLTTCDGSLVISELNGALAPGTGPWTELFLFQPVNVNRYYVGAKKDYTVHLGAPNINAPTDGGAGGSLAAGTYIYAITALDGAGGETVSSGPGTITIVANHLINVTWSAVTRATSYNVYRTPVNGLIGTARLLTNVATNSFTDNGSITLGTALIPGVDTTQACLVYVIPATSYGAANIIVTLPADPFVPADSTPGGSGGGGGTTNPSGGSPPNPSGGVSGNVSPIPQFVQYANKTVMALGNGFAPQLITDGTPPTATAITNTFTASYPNWVATTVFAIGTIILPTAGNAGSFIFKATQGGTTGAGAPVWPQTANQQVADNNIIWVNQGIANTTPAPRGAAHAEVYAGTLWLANTSPTTTADNFDGPSCVKMSDLNNPTSWNPLNVAFVGRDDSDYITGLKTFTIAAEGISPTGSLVVFKNFKTYQIIGVFGANDFAIQEAKTDMGCIAPRSIQFLPGFGIVRLTHLGVAIFDGTNDRLISEEIRPYLFGSLNSAPDVRQLDWNFAYLSKGSQSANPPMYMCATPVALSNLAATFVLTAVASTLTAPAAYFLRATRFTTVNGLVAETDISTETRLNLPDGTQSLRLNASALDVSAVKFRVYVGTQSGGYTNYAELTPAQFAAGQTFSSMAAFPNSGSINAGIGGLTRILCYDMVLKAWTVIDLPFAISVLRQFRAAGTRPITVCGGFNDGSVRRLQSGDADFDGAAVNWAFRSAEVYGRQANERVYYRRLTIRGTTTQVNLAINAVINFDGAEQTTSPMTIYLLGNQLGTHDFLAQLDIGHTRYTTHVTLSGTGNIEIASLDWEAAALREGVPPVI